MDINQILKKHPNLTIKKNEQLSKYTYTKTGGPAELLFIPTEVEEVVSIVKWAKKGNFSITVIGNGSNLIIRDGGIRGVTLLLTHLNKISVKNNEVKAQTGVSIIAVSKKASNHKLAGLEFACGIPGSVGGAVYMNAGAYGGEVKDVIEKVTILNREGEVLEVSNKDLEFSYRRSKLMDTKYIVLDVTFALIPGSFLKIKSKMIKLNYLRRSKQPLNYPSCGSVFKNSPNHYTGRLIKEMGLQGKTIGGAQVSKKHPNFIINLGNASSTDYIKLIEYIQLAVFEKYGYEFEVEPLIIGEHTKFEKN